MTIIIISNIISLILGVRMGMKMALEKYIHIFQDRESIELYHEVLSGKLTDQEEVKRRLEEIERRQYDDE